MSKALVHYYFATRQELLRKAFAFSEQRWQSAIDAEGRPASRPVPPGSRACSSSASIQHSPSASSARSATRLEQPPLRRGVAPSRRALLPRLAGCRRRPDRGRKGDGSIGADVDAASSGWRLAAAADGFDSLLYLDLVDRDEAVRLLDARDDRPRAEEAEPPDRRPRARSRSRRSRRSARPRSRRCRRHGARGLPRRQPRPRRSGPHTIARVHEKRIEIRWRDVDAFRHVNNAVYATYLEECRDELAEQVLEGVGDPGTSCSRASRSTTAAS